MNESDDRKRPVYKIGIAAKLCSIHPQTLRAYERQGFVAPAREGEKDRMYSEYDVERVRQIQRLTRELGVNLAGVEIILNLLDQMDEVRGDLETQVKEYIQDAERRLSTLLRGVNVPVRQGESLLPVPKISVRKRVSF